MSSTSDDLFGEDELTIRGQIGTSSVPELLRSLLTSGETGILTLRQGEFAKSIFIHQGRVVYAAGNNPDERLGENLLLRGKITARQYLEASKLVRAGRRLGAILVELGALDPDELVAVVEHQTKEVLMDLFGWTYGEYELVIKAVDPDNVISLNISTENLILDGIRRCRAWSQVMRGLGDIETVLHPVASSEVLIKLDLAGEEQEVLSHVNGRSTIEQICDVSYLSNFETCRILWAFLVLRLVRKGRPDEERPPHVVEHERELELEHVVEQYNQMFNRIYAFIRGRVGDQVDAFMEDALEQVSRQYGSLFDGVDLKQYGRADFEQMLANVADLPPDQRRSLMVTGLNELVYVIQYAIRSKYGKPEEAVVSGIIKDGFRKLGMA